GKEGQCSGNNGDLLHLRILRLRIRTRAAHFLIDESEVRVVTDHSTQQRDSTPSLPDVLSC
ncbi:MAG TPA: hypothetical protein VK542_07775, partial [Gemmatimonadaceae bacterium]|nr:hypothetical protein [Gemmatimonadaceae bacterium]